jgi:hypothetical protein
VFAAHGPVLLGHEPMAATCTLPEVIGRSIALAVAAALLGAACTPSEGAQHPVASDEVAALIETPTIPAVTIATPTPAPTPDPTPPEEPPPAQLLDDGPASVLVLGDSVTHEIAPALLAALASTGEIHGHDNTFMGFGLSRIPLGLDWPAMVTSLVADVEPDAVVIQTGIWDFDTGALGAPYADPRPADPDWQTKYAAVMTGAVDMLSAGGAQVYWLTMLPMDWTERVHAMNSTVTAFGESDDRVTVIDLMPDFVDSDGLAIKSIAGLDGSQVPIRKVDDIHLCRYGAKIAAQIVAERLVADFGLSVEPGWEDGAWRDDPLYELDPCLEPG